MYKRNKKGFTLIELLVVISIIAVLSGVIIQSLQSTRLRAYNATRLSNIDQIDKSLQLYLTKTNAGFPSTGGSWQCVGLTSGLCWNNYAGPATNLNTALAGNISQIPRDPAIAIGSVGDYYMYNSSLTGAMPDYGTYAGPGAYIEWLVNVTGGANPCGRGYAYGPVSNGYQTCLFFLGAN